MANFKPTLKEPVNQQSEKFEKNFNKTMTQNNLLLKEVDDLLDENEKSLKKKIFSLAKMEALVFSDPKLSAKYELMSDEGEFRYGYHFNETIMNELFNSYVLNSPRYLQKYKMAIPKEKKRRDQSGINQLKKDGEKKMTQSGLPKLKKKEVDENVEPQTKVIFLVNETDPENRDIFAYFPEETHNGEYKTGYAHVGQHTAVHPDYANESRPATPEEYADLKAELEGQGYNLEVLNGMNETTSDGSAGGAAGYVGYAGPAAWGDGDLMKGGKSKAMRKPIWSGGTMIKESNYLTDPKGFEKYINSLNEQTDVDYIQDNSEAYGDLNNMNKDNVNIIKKDLKTNKMDSANIKNSVAIEEESMIADNPMTMANKPQAVGNQGNGVPMGMQSTGGMNEIENPAQDAANANYESPMDRHYNSDAWVQAQRDAIGIADEYDEDGNLIKELNEELEAFSIHHNKLKKMSEDRKPSALVLRDRVGSENEKNFKKDLQHSGTKEIINVEKELMWKDEQTDVKDPQKAGLDIEKKTKDALKNVGNSANEKGDEIPKRNLTNEEQDEVNNYRLGLGDLVYDNEVGKRFEDRMKTDMGDTLYQQRQDKLKFRGKAPMYNKEAQPTQTTGVKKVQFNKEESGWNEKDGIKESMITGRYLDGLGKRKLIDFTMNEVKVTTSVNESLFELDFTGLGNTYNSKTIDNKVSVNENVVNAISNNKFYTDGKQIFAIKNAKKSLNESVDNNKPVMTEQMIKMKHLLGYKPETYTNTGNVKKNRGF